MGFMNKRPKTRTRAAIADDFNVSSDTIWILDTDRLIHVPVKRL